MSDLLQKISLSAEDKFTKFAVWKYNTFTAPAMRKNFNAKLAKNTPPINYKTFYSNNERHIEIREEDILEKQLVLTCYFTQKADPQFGIIRSKADIKYIAPWYESMLKHRIKGIVVHDGLEQSFINEYQNEFVQFRKFTAGNYSIFEERWMAYYMFLAATGLQYVFFTDANDVYITKNPFVFIDKDDVLYIGRDQANRVRHSDWLLNELGKLSEDAKTAFPKTLLYQPLYNAGVVGGNRSVLLFFISRMIELLVKTQSDFHKDMSLVNWIIHEHFAPRLSYHVNEAKLANPKDDAVATQKNIFSGFPLNSGFKSFDMNSEAVFIHK